MMCKSNGAFKREYVAFFLFKMNWQGTDGMEFRPCIDIHNGKVKQIVGGSLRDAGNEAQENFVSEQDAAFRSEETR